MKTLVAKLVEDALAQLPDLAALAADIDVEATIERTRDASHGDFASNIAMRLAKPARSKPRDLATQIVAAIGAADAIDAVEIAGPGFINFRLSDSAFHAEVREILTQRNAYGHQSTRETPQILLEFVSANPTGPLHVGHGRHAAYGATLANLLRATGHSVKTEYYVNDAGRQMDILGASVWLRWLETQGVEFEFPAKGYRGDYIVDIARGVQSDALQAVSADDLLAGLPEDEEAIIETLIARAKASLGEEGFFDLRQQSLESIRADIEADLAEFGVHFDRWYSEQSLTTSGQIDAALTLLEKRGMIYTKDGAKWFKATDFGDEKDRVVVRDNGVKTYFASDIAYHFDKRERGFDHLIDILGSDHHGYVSRVRGGLVAMGYAADDLEVELMQFVALYRDGEKQSMSTRSGEFVTLRELREEVGNDAARFFYVSRSNDQHLDFDLELAKSKSTENPVFYIQYAHARIASVFRKLSEKGFTYDAASGSDNLARLTESHEEALMRTMSRYPEILQLAAMNRAPQHLVHYLRDLAKELQAYYNAHEWRVDNEPLRNARLTLVSATQLLIASGLALLGVSAPESM